MCLHIPFIPTSIPSTAQFYYCCQFVVAVVSFLSRLILIFLIFFSRFDFALLRLAACEWAHRLPDESMGFWHNVICRTMTNELNDKQRCRWRWRRQQQRGPIRRPQWGVSAMCWKLELLRIGVLPLFIYILFYVLGFTSNFKIVSFDRNLQRTYNVHCTRYGIGWGMLYVLPTLTVRIRVLKSDPKS